MFNVSGVRKLPAVVCGLLMLSVACVREKVFHTVPFAAKTPHSAVEPVPRDDQDWWVTRQQGVLDRVRQGNVDLILIGDSITHGWDGQKELWDRYFAPRNTVNMGFSGDRTQHVLWRLQHGSLEGISPRLAMIMIGTNNSNGDDNSAEEIADGIVAICRELRTRLPHTKILLLAIFPRGEKPSPQRDKNARASLLASGIADGDNIVYLDINQRLLESDGTLSKDVMPDLLHPDAHGYRIWAGAVDPVITRMMNEPAK